MQAHADDAEAALSLLDLFCDLWTPLPQPRVGLLLSLRGGIDVSAARLRTYTAYFRSVSIHTVRQLATGWPDGCNVQAQETWQAFLKTDYDALMFGEGDSVPVKADFMARLLAEVDALDGQDKHVTGFYVQSLARDRGHINGNLIALRSLARACPEFMQTPPGKEGQWKTAWDHCFREVLIRHGVPSREIFSKHGWGSEKKPFDNPQELFLPFALPEHHPLGPTMEPSYVHGCKRTALAQAAVRRRLLDGHTEPAVYGGLGESPAGVVARKREQHG